MLYMNIADVFGSFLPPQNSGHTPSLNIGPNTRLTCKSYVSPFLHTHTQASLCICGTSISDSFYFALPFICKTIVQDTVIGMPFRAMQTLLPERGHFRSPSHCVMIGLAMLSQEPWSLWLSLRWAADDLFSKLIAQSHSRFLCDSGWERFSGYQPLLRNLTWQTEGTRQGARQDTERHDILRSLSFHLSIKH